MPSRPRRPTAVVLSALAGVLAAALVFAVVSAILGSGKARSRLGDDRFTVGRARSLAAVVDRRGPLLFQDLLGGHRDVYLQHLGTAWLAFEAHAPGAPRRCQLRWQPAARLFLDPCDHRTYPAGGTGLTSYPTHVDPKGKLAVDLRSPLPPAPSLPPAPPPSVATDPFDDAGPGARP